MADLARHWEYLEEAWRAAQASPLSPRRALMVAVLIDAYVDRIFMALPAEDDILEFRATLAANPALRYVFELCAHRRDGPRLMVEAVTVPLSDYGALSVGDFMVSLYNDHSVQRVKLVTADGTKQLAHAVLAEAIAALGIYLPLTRDPA